MCAFVAHKSGTVFVTIGGSISFLHCFSTHSRYWHTQDANGVIYKFNIINQVSLLSVLHAYVLLHIWSFKTCWLNFMVHQNIVWSKKCHKRSVCLFEEKQKKTLKTLWLFFEAQLEFCLSTAINRSKKISAAGLSCCAAFYSNEMMLVKIQSFNTLINIWRRMLNKSFFDSFRYQFYFEGVNW